MTQEPALQLTEDEIMTCYKVLEMIRDYHDETGLVHEVNTLNEAHSLVQEFQMEQDL
jgi:hypothetical protein